jgi:hypothetical protein
MPFYTFNLSVVKRLMLGVDRVWFCASGRFHVHDCHFVDFGCVRGEISRKAMSICVLQIRRGWLACKETAVGR